MRVYSLHLLYDKAPSHLTRFSAIDERVFDDFRLEEELADQMAHFFALGLEIALVGGFGRDFG
jgi:hypothetical protein